MILLKLCQFAGTRLSVNCTLKMSLVGANQTSKKPPLVKVTLLMDGIGYGIGLTMTKNEFVALKFGVPLSVTIVVMVLLVPAWAIVGVQMMMPLVSILAPTGGFS